MKPVLHLLGKHGWQAALPTPHNIYLESVTWRLICSFKNGSLRNTLEGSLFKIREINQESDSQLIAGKCLFISHESWREYRRLVIKWKTLSYRLRKLYPEIDYLCLQDPDRATSILINLEQKKVERGNYDPRS